MTGRTGQRGHQCSCWAGLPCAGRRLHIRSAGWRGNLRAEGGRREKESCIPDLYTFKALPTLLGQGSEENTFPLEPPLPTKGVPIAFKAQIPRVLGPRFPPRTWLTWNRKSREAWGLSPNFLHQADRGQGPFRSFIE